MAGRLAATLDRRVPDDSNTDPSGRAARRRVDRLQLLVDHPAADADQQTPLAYISLVPAIALALAAVRARPLKPEPPIHDRQVDYTIGIPLILPALAINELLPARMSAMFWVYRIDLFTLPFFVAGAVAIIFGCRVLWRQKLAIAFLFLAWPYPYQKYLLGVLNAFTTVTLLAMQKIAVWTHLAKPVPSSDNTLFTINHHGTTFALSIVSACSGVNGVVGFLLVGSAFAAIVRGPIVRKVLWLFGGMVLLWVLNLGASPSSSSPERSGASLAINVFHPFIGLVTVLPGRDRHALVDPAPRACTSRSAGQPSGVAQRQAPFLRLVRRSRRRTQGAPRRAEGVPGRGDGGGGRPRHRGQQRRTAQLQPGGRSRGPGEADARTSKARWRRRVGRAVRDHLRLGQAAVRRHLGLEPLQLRSDGRGDLHTNAPWSPM